MTTLRTLLLAALVVGVPALVTLYFVSPRDVPAVEHGTVPHLATWSSGVGAVPWQ